MPGLERGRRGRALCPARCQVPRQHYCPSGLCPRDPCGGRRDRKSNQSMPRVAKRSHGLGQAPCAAGCRGRSQTSISTLQEGEPGQAGKSIAVREQQGQDLGHGTSTWIQGLLDSLCAFSQCHLSAKGHRSQNLATRGMEPANHSSSRRFSTPGFHSRVSGTQ